MRFTINSECDDLPLQIIQHTAYVTSNEIKTMVLEAYF